MKKLQNIFEGKRVRFLGGILEEISGKCQSEIYGGIPAGVFEKKISPVFSSEILQEKFLEIFLKELEEFCGEIPEKCWNPGLPFFEESKKNSLKSQLNPF